MCSVFYNETTMSSTRFLSITKRRPLAGQLCLRFLGLGLRQTVRQRGDNRVQVSALSVDRRGAHVAARQSGSQYTLL